jgi:putative transcriptional regulator
MAIVVNLDLLLVKRKMKLTELASLVDITLANMSVLKQNKARAIRFSTLDAICRELGCQPGDLLEYVPGPPPAQIPWSDPQIGRPDPDAGSSSGDGV